MHSSAEAFLYVANPPFFLPLSREGVFPTLPPLRPQRTTASSTSVKKGSSLDSSMSSRSTMSYASALTNALLVTYTSESFVNTKVVQRLVFFIAYEYALLGVKLTYKILVDSVPPEVTLQLERADFLATKIVANERDEEKGGDVVANANDADIVVHHSDPDLAL